MTHYYFYFNLAHYPVAFVTKVGENQQDQARLKMMLNLAQHEQPQRIMFEPMSDNYDKWKEYDPRVRQQERRVNFIDLWRFHFSPLQRELLGMATLSLRLKHPCLSPYREKTFSLTTNI